MCGKTTPGSARPRLQVLLGALLLAFLLCPPCGHAAPQALPTLLLPDPGLQARQLAVVVNRRDPLSAQIADYYLQQHAVPRENLVYVSFNPGSNSVPPAEFRQAMQALDAQLGDNIQGLLLTWARPYRVGCMSIGAAFTFGYDEKYCASGCKPTAVNHYAQGNSLQPLRDFGIRPSMLLAATTLADAKALIDRGKASRGWYYRAPQAHAAAWLLETSDRARSVRKHFFPEAVQRFGGLLDVHSVQAESVQGERDILFYFTGAKQVADIDSNHYLPGAVADHLTSTGGQLTDSRQMSAIEWLRAGATGSYGAVVEPCNFPGKFPHPPRLMEQYIAGRTLLEAYWKSVLMPGQGVFIGDPLAAPFRGYRMRATPAGIEVTSSQPLPGRYQLEVAETEGGPFTAVGEAFELRRPPHRFVLPPAPAAVYRLTQLPYMLR